MTRSEVRFGGFGGQGIVLAGRLLGHAASIQEGRSAVLTQAYGPEARGGASNTDLIISDEPVDYPFVTRPDVLVLTFQEACQKFQHMVSADGILIVEEDLVSPAATEVAVHRIPATRLAEELGNRIVMNVIILGYMLGLTDLVSREAIEAAMSELIHPKALALDLDALAAGYEHAAGQGTAS